MKFSWGKVVVEQTNVGRLSVFGGISCALPDGTPIPLKGRRTRELLASLALSGNKPELRDRISGRLWPDCSTRNARKSLNTALWRLRGTLKDAQTDPDNWIHQDSETLALVCKGGPTVDLGLFKQFSNAPELPLSADSGALLRLYAGKFAAGLDAEWVEIERRKLHQQFTDMLYRAAATWSSSHRLRDAMALAETLVLDDPLDEGARRLLLRLQIDSGNRSKAFREFTELENVLQNDLGVAPSPKTCAVLSNSDSTMSDSSGRTYRIEADEKRNEREEAPIPGYRIEAMIASDDLSNKVTELKRTAEKLLSGLMKLERML